MLDIKNIREHPEKIKESLARKNISPDTVDAVLKADSAYRGLLGRFAEIREQQNEFSKNIAKFSGQQKKQELARMKELKTELSDIEADLKKAEEMFQNAMYALPNIPFSEVPSGDASLNAVLREVGEKPEFDFTPRDYNELGERLDLIDTERAAKVSGSRFGYLKHEAPLLEFALVQFVFSRLINEDFLAAIIAERKLSVSPKPFIPLVPPVMIRPEAFRAMGRLDPGQEEERYFLPKDNLYLVGSAEHTTGPMHGGETFDEAKLPHRHIAFSTCFRREAGSYGKDTRGILRVHQFDKLELFSFALPHASNEEHELLLAIQEKFMQELGIPYRVILVAAGDMGWPDAKQYDIEAWLPGQKEYRETHSASNTTDFQSRRLLLKYRKVHDGKTDFAHTLNATALAIGRTLIAILENYQQKDGSVKVPSALLPFMHGIFEIRPRK